MALHTLSLERKAIDLAVSGSGSRLAVLSGDSLALYALDMHKRPLPKPALLWTSSVPKDHCPRHVAFVGDEQIVVLSDSWEEDESCLWRTVGESLELHGPIVESDSVSSLTCDVEYNNFYIQLQNGALHQLDATETSMDLPPTSSPIYKFTSLAPEFKVVVVDGQVRQVDRTKEIWLTRCSPWLLA